MNIECGVIKRVTPIEILYTAVGRNQKSEINNYVALKYGKAL